MAPARISLRLKHGIIMKYHEYPVSVSHLTSRLQPSKASTACRGLGFPGELVGPEGEEQGVSRWQSRQNPGT